MKITPGPTFILYSLTELSVPRSSVCGEQHESCFAAKIIGKFEERVFHQERVKVRTAMAVWRDPKFGWQTHTILVSVDQKRDAHDVATAHISQFGTA